MASDKAFHQDRATTEKALALIESQVTKGLGTIKRLSDAANTTKSSLSKHQSQSEALPKFLNYVYNFFECPIF